MSKLFYKECGKLHLAFHQLMDFLHLLAKYLNKIRQAKKREYEDVEREKENSKGMSEKKGAWVTNLFSTKPQSTINEEELKRMDAKLLKFYTESLDKIKQYIKNMNIIWFERSYINVIQQLNLGKSLFIHFLQ